MLNYTELCGLLKKVTYYEGWEFRLSDDHPEGLRLHIAVKAITNPRAPGTLDLNIVTFVPDTVRKSPEAFYEWLDYRLRRIAVHEHMEFFHVDGRPWRDPHTET